jgi:hypothetical protein
MKKNEKFTVILLLMILFQVILFGMPKVEANSSINQINKNNGLERWALVIGISNYYGYNNLQYCDDDARSIKSWLMNQNFPESNILMLVDIEATKSNIVEAFSWISQNCDGNDYFFFFYSGHGSSSGSETSIVPHDALINGDLTETELKNYFNIINYSKLIALFDSCSSGGLLDSLSGPDRIILTACTGSQDCIEDILFLKHGVFTSFFLNSFENTNADTNSDDQVTIEEAYTYTYNKSYAHALEYFNHVQNAQIYDSISGEFFLSPYFEVVYESKHYGIDPISISINPVGFEDPVNINLTIYLGETTYQTINIQEINQTHNISLSLPLGNYEFQISTDLSNEKYTGKLYLLDILSFYSSNMGLIILIVSIISSVVLFVFILLSYKHINFIKLRMKEFKMSEG